MITRKLPGIDSVYITGASFNFWPDYRLDIRLKPGQKAQVPLNAAIFIKRLYQKNLGIYGYAGTVGMPQYYIPVEVQSTVNKENSAGYTLTLTSTKSVADITWDYIPMLKGAVTHPTVVKDTIRYTPARSPIIIPLTFPVVYPAGTIVNIQVWGRIAGQKNRERLQTIRLMIPKA